MSAPPLSRNGQAQPLKRGSGVFDIIFCGGHRERGGVTLTPTQWRQLSTRVPITVVQHGERHVVGEGMPLVDRENNLRIRGMWSSTPLGEYERTLVAQEVLRYAELEYTDTIDDAGQLMRQVLGGVLILPTDPPPAPGADTGAAEPTAETAGLAARIYTASPAQRAALADQIFACVVALGGTPEATPATEVSTQVGS